MSAKSNASSKKVKKNRKPDEHDGSSRRTNSSLRDSFRSDIWKNAIQLAQQYQIILESEAGHWHGRGLELPHVFGDGSTPQACIKSTRQALAAAVAYLMERRRKPPSPARNGRRTQQVNVRLTAEEKAMLESIARGKGFQGLSDYLRSAALQPVN
jgi:predicted RNase H-like HicB family nuclease